MVREFHKVTGDHMQVYTHESTASPNKYNNQLENKMWEEKYPNDHTKII